MGILNPAAELPLTRPGHQEWFSLDESFRSVLLRASADDASLMVRGVHATALAERFVKSGDYAQGARVAMRGGRARMASWSMRAAVARGQVSFDEAVRALSGGLRLREVSKDPFLALIAAVLTARGRADDAGLMFLAEAHKNSDLLLDGVFDPTLVDDPGLEKIEQSMWRALILLLASRAIGDWTELSTVVAECVDLLIEKSTVKLAAVAPLVSLLSSETEISLALLGKSAVYSPRQQLALLETGVESDVVYAVGNVALAASIRGNNRDAFDMLKYAGATGSSTRVAALAKAFIALDQRDESQIRTLFASEPSFTPLQSHLNDLDAYLRVRAAYFLGEDAALRQRLATINVKRSAPWVSAEVEAFRAEISISEQRVRRAEEAFGRRGIGGERVSPAIRLAFAKARVSSGHVEAALRIVQSIWTADGVSTRYRGRAYAIGAYCAQMLGDNMLYRELMKELNWISDENMLLEPYEDLPPECLAELVLSSAPPLTRTRPPLRSTEARVDLTPREIAVLEALETHVSANDIAAQLFVSTNTVKTQLRHIYRKLKVHSREDALRAGIDAGLL